MIVHTPIKYKYRQLLTVLRALTVPAIRWFIVNRLSIQKPNIKIPKCLNEKVQHDFFYTGSPFVKETK